MKLDPDRRRISRALRANRQSDYAGGDRSRYRHGLLGWAMLSLPVACWTKRSACPAKAKSLRFCRSTTKTCCASWRNNSARRHSGSWFGQAFGWIVGIVFFLLLLERGQYRHRRDDRLALHDGARWRDAAAVHRLNRHGVPMYPLLIAVGLPVVVLRSTANFDGSGRSLRHRRGRRDHGQSRLVHFQSTLSASLGTIAFLFGFTFAILVSGRDHSGPDQTGCALLRRVRSRRGSPCAPRRTSGMD